MTGDFARAVADGQAYSGLIGPWSLVQVHTFQTINHGVMPSDYALQCGACHGSLPGGPVRMDLQGALGYELKAGRNVVCLQCHGPEESKPFLAIHEKHVTDKNFDCSWCHSFTRETEVAPAKDIVTIQSAAFDPVGRTLTLVATSSGQPQVSLAAEGLGPLQYKSWKGFYRSTFSGVNEAPANVTVMSSGGGWELRPVPFPVTDLVTVQSIAHDPAGQTMTVVATSSNQPGAALTAAGFGNLDWKSWLNFYRKTFTGVAVKPETVTVTSSGRGWDTRPVPFPQDSVSIQSIAYDAVNQSLTVIATSSDQPQVTLTAEGLGPLAWKSWLNFYRMTFTGVTTKPASVTVNSNLGGTATIPVP